MLQRLFALGLGCAACVAAQDPVQVSSDYRVEMKNSWSSCE